MSSAKIIEKGDFCPPFQGHGVSLRVGLSGGAGGNGVGVSRTFTGSCGLVASVTGIDR